jgi:epoxyqueuosine reductase
VDTAPLLERDFAEQAGLGFIGRNTCLITPGLGSWTFLAALATPEGLDQGRKRKNEGSSVLPPWSFVGCGRCTRCLDACPTRAFVGPYVLDARRCISYLTIELRGPIPRELRPLMGNWVFGCDVCQEVCPYNRAVPPAASAASGVPHAASPLAGRSMAALALLELLSLDEAKFRALFRGTAILRAKRGGFVRNACIAAGNWGDPRALPGLIPLLADAEPLVRGHAAWALGRIGGAAAMNALRDALQREDHSWVREEIESARM